VIAAQLDLFPEELDALPWAGQSPRSLTRASKALFLRRKPQKDDCFFVDVSQLDMFPEAMEMPLRYEGAPSLLPLPRVRRPLIGG